MTAFLAPDGSVWEYTAMPQGCSIGSQTFQEAINGVLGSLRFSVCVVFMDDIVIFNRSWEDHLSSVNAVLQALENYGMQCNPKKCRFFAKSFKFVGHVVSADEGN